MSHSIPLSISPSPEFIALCRAQIALLTEELNSAWGIVYLRGGRVNGRETQLIPVVVYPSTVQAESIQELPKMWPKNALSLVLPVASSIGNPSENASEDNLTLWEQDVEQERQIILPLVYEQRMMGLLVTRRNGRKWNQQELDQIEKIAETLAIGCFLDQRQRWYEEQLKEQRYQQSLERDRLDNLLHQLRNPLTALKTFGKLLLKRFLPEDTNQPIIKGILRESDRLQELLEEFEAQIEQRTSETPTIELNSSPEGLSEEGSESSVRFLLPSSDVTLEPLSVNDTLEPLIDSGQAIAQERKIALISNIPEHLPLVQANSKALREVFSNLIDNALKYTPQGGNVSISAQISPTILEISISDTGYGIPSEDREHLFERHYRGVQAQGDIPGTGLGLAIAKELLEQMGGEIQAISPRSENSNPPGTTFTVGLPLS